MTAANVRVRECWDRACALAGFKGAGGDDPRGIGSQVDAAVEVLSGPEMVAVRALLCEAWRLVSHHGDAEGAADFMRLAAAMGEQRGRVLGALRAAQVIEDALWSEGTRENGGAIRMVVGGVRMMIAEAMTNNGFGPQEEVTRG